MEQFTVSSLPRLLSEDELAAALRVDRATLFRWRQQRCGVPAIRMGGRKRGRLMYDPDVVRGWLSRRTITSAPELAPRLARTRRPRARKAAPAEVAR
ncbi:MAG TPA: hypothetical protein DCM87_04625 [Planctomycetes bacterium]|nr:hypothetical protein [Planctomycetota bacterium]